MEINPILQETEENKTPKSQQSLPLSVVIFIVIICSSMFGAIFGFMAGGTLNMIFPQLAKKFNSPIVATNQSQQLNAHSVPSEDSEVISSVEVVSPAVVSVVITKDVSKLETFGLFDFFPLPNAKNNNGSGGTQKQTIGGGTGFLVSSDGMIVTNKHVVDDPQADYTVVLNDEKKYSAKVLAKDPTQDIAILKIDGSNFPHVVLGDSDSIKVGQTAIAIGNSLGEFSNSVNKGIISGLQRNLTASSDLGQTEQLSGIIQTDAAINFGNSGGPLININGEVVGVNVARAQGADNVGFAIPINRVKRIIDQVGKTGKITTPFLGVRFVVIDDQMQKANNLPYSYGVLVRSGQQATDLAVIPGSAADKAGITENDIILEIDGKQVNNNNPLSDIIAQHNVGDQITIKFWHKGDIKESTVTLTERPNQQ